MTNVPVQIRLYDIVVRRDDEAALVLPTGVWQAGLNSTANPGVGLASSINFPGAEPFESRDFCTRFRVVKKTTFTLGAGSEHVHIISGNPPWLMDRGITNPYTVLGRRTRFLMMIVEGGVTNDINANPVLNSVSYSKHAVDVVTEYKAKFYALEKSRTVYTSYSNLAVLADELTVTEDADVVTPVVIAT